MSDRCCDCSRPARFDFHLADGTVESRCGDHAYPLLAHGRPAGCDSVTVRQPAWLQRRKGAVA